MMGCVLLLGGCGSPSSESAVAPEPSRAMASSSEAPRPVSSSTPAAAPACLGLGPAESCESSEPPQSRARGDAALSVLGRPLEACSTDPVTGWFRDGHCRTNAADRGVHVVCAEVDEPFLEFTAARGNDLSTPAPSLGFPGLRAGDHWCLCAARWEQARRAGVAPRVVLGATDDAALRTIDRQTLEAYAVPRTSTAAK